MLESVPDGVAAAAAFGETAQPETTQTSSAPTTKAIEKSLRQVLNEPLLHAGEIDVEQHDDEQEEHRHRADIDDNEDHREELRPQDEEEPRRADEGEDQEQHGVNRVPGENDCERRSDQDRRENPEEYRLGHVASLFKNPALRPPPANGKRRRQSAGRGSRPHPRLPSPPPSLATAPSRERGHRYGASIAMLRASSRSQRPPFASSRSLS